MCAPGCLSLSEARMTEEKAEKLWNRGGAGAITRPEPAMFDPGDTRQRDQFQEAVPRIIQNLQWLEHAAEYLEGIKFRASRGLADINAKQAKEYQELFPPTCPQPDLVPNLNVEIMKALAGLQADVSPADQVSRKETNGEFQEVTSAFSKGPTAKNTLGARGVDAEQVSGHRGPPTDRPPDRPDRGRNVSGGARRRWRAPSTLSISLRPACARIIV
jgi:hypothetical protein